jgi:hypothetical protein
MRSTGISTAIIIQEGMILAKVVRREPMGTGLDGKTDAVKKSRTVLRVEAETSIARRRRTGRDRDENVSLMAMTTASIEGSEVRRPAQAKRPTNERSILETTVIQISSTVFPEEGEKRMIEQLETL